MLPKLVTGMLMVPFTWFIVSAALSISNVLTASVIQLPISTIKIASSDKVKEYFNTQKIIPKNITLDLRSKAEKNKMLDSTDCSKSSKECLSISEFLSDSNGWAYNLLSVYAYGIFHVEKYMDMTKNQIEKWEVDKVVKVVQKLGFGIVFFVVFGILVIAIVYALFSRAIMLWLYAMFSPIFALNYVLGSKNKSLEKLTVKEFISLAMVPVYVSAALSFGLMFLSLVMNPANYWSTDSIAKIKSDTKGEQSFKLWWENGVMLTTKGDPNLMDWLNGAFQTGQGLIGSVIMGFLALAILWMAVMAALGSSKITEAAVAPIKWFGDEIGKLAMKAPQYIPIPLWKDKQWNNRSISMAGMSSIPNTISSALSQHATSEGGKIWQSFAKSMGIEVGELTTAMQQAVAKLNWNKDINAQKEVWKDVYGKIGDTKNLNTNKAEIIPKFQEMLAATTMDTADRKKLEDTLTHNPEKFIVDFEKYLDNKNAWKWGGLLPAGTELNANNVLQSSKNGTTGSSVPNKYNVTNIDISRPDWAHKVNVNIDGKTPKEITFNIKNKSIEEKDKLKASLKKEGLSDTEVDAAISEIEAKLK